MESGNYSAHDLAILLIEHEKDTGRQPDETVGALHIATEKLRSHLTNRFGTDGYRALMTRSLGLATVDCPWLDAVHINVNGEIAGFDEASKMQTPATAVAGSVAIISRFIHLLETFVGADLAIRLLTSLWPNVIDAGAPRTKEVSNE